MAAFVTQIRQLTVFESSVTPKASLVSASTTPITISIVRSRGTWSSRPAKARRAPGPAHPGERRSANRLCIAYRALSGNTIASPHDRSGVLQSPTESGSNPGLQDGLSRNGAQRGPNPLDPLAARAGVDG